MGAHAEVRHLCRRVPLENLLTGEVLATFNPSAYFRGEATILKPAIEALGFTLVTFSDGERDCWGPLSRIVSAYKDDRRFEFVYGMWGVR